MHLDAILRATLGGGRRQGGGHRGGEFVVGGFVVPCSRVPAALGRFVDRADGVPHRGGRALGGGDHLGALVLDGLELADRTAELLTDLGVLRGGVGGPAGQAHGFSRQQTGGDGPPGGLGHRGQQPVGTDLDAVGPHVRNRAQRVDRPQRHDLQRFGIEDRPLDAAFDVDRQHQHRGLRRGGHRSGLTPDHQRVALAAGGEVGFQCEGGDGLAGGEFRQHLGLRVVSGDQRAGDGRRHVGAGNRAVAELGDRDRQFHQAEALPADRLRQVQTVQTLLGGRPPIRRWAGDRGFQCCVQHVGRRHSFDQGPYRPGQILVLGGDCDGHGSRASLAAE